MMRDTLERKFVMIKGESFRYESEVNPTVFSQNKLQWEREAKKRARGEIKLFSLMADGTDFERRFFEYSQSISNLSFKGKLVIRPYRSLYEVVLDGVHGCYDVGMIAENISEEDGYLFAVKVPGKEDKAFAYVLYDADGNILKARQAFNLEIKNQTVLNYLRLFAKDIFIPSMKRAIHTA